MRILFAALLILAACAKKESPAPAVPLSGLQKVDSLAALKQYSAALSVLTIEGQQETRVRPAIHASYKALIDAIKADPEAGTAVLVDAHLGYGVWLEYYGMDPADRSSMKDVMTGALAHFRRVLILDPANEKAKSEIAQIEGIYKSMNREIPAAIAD